MRRNLSAVARATLQSTLGILNQVVPRRAAAVVHGYPDTEGNSVEIVRALQGQYRGAITWLVEDPQAVSGWAHSAGIDLDRVILQRHRSLGGVWAYLRGEVIFFTHGLYGNPKPPARATIVNLWHGDGIKANSLSKADGEPRFRADYLVRSTSWLTELRARQTQLPTDRILVVGNPRIDQFARGNRERLTNLGFDPERRFVLWMPTFRKARTVGLTEGQADTTEDYASQLNHIASDASRIFAKHEITLVIKPHPSDANNWDIPGTITIDNQRIHQAGFQLYEFLGLADGLITDYSSTWIDYLALDRPISFCIPDEEEYAEGRGFVPTDALDWLPGPRLSSPEDWEQFATEVSCGRDEGAARRMRVRAHVGLAPHVDASAAHRLLNELEQDGVFRRSGGLSVAPDA